MAEFHLLVDAAIQRNLEQVKRLLQEGRDINEENKNGYSALIWAAIHGNLEMVSLLIEYGARINHQNQAGYAALHFASANNRMSIVSLLIEKGADLNIKTNYGETPLMKSAYWGYFSIVSLLLRNGAKPSFSNNGGETALDMARERNKSDCISILEKYEHFHRYRKVWLSFATSLRSFQDNQNHGQESKQIQSHIKSPSLMRVMDSSDLVRFVTEFM